MSTGICPVCQRRVAISRGLVVGRDTIGQDAIGWHRVDGKDCPGWYAKPLPPVYPEETP